MSKSFYTTYSPSDEATCKGRGEVHYEASDVRIYIYIYILPIMFYFLKCHTLYISLLKTT